MNLGAIQDAVRAAIVSASGLADVRVRWENTNAAGLYGAFPSIDLSLSGPNKIGWDVTTTDPETVARTISGPREITVSVSIETDDQTPGYTSTQYASNVVTRLQRKSILAALRAAEVALATIGKVIKADYASDDRMVSRCMFDVAFNIVENDTDSTDAGDYVESLTFLSDDLIGEDGDPVTPQIDLTVTKES